MSSKIDLTPLVERQLATFRGYSEFTGKLDFFVFVFVPVGAGLAVAVWGPDVKGVGAVLGGVGVFTALLFALLVNVFNLSVKLRRDEGVRPEQPLALNVDELFYNVGWSVVIGLALVITMTAATVTHTATEALGGVWVGLIVALFVHLVITVLMAVVRMVSTYESIADLAPKRPVAPTRDTNSHAA